MWLQSNDLQRDSSGCAWVRAMEAIRGVMMGSRALINSPVISPEVNSVLVCGWERGLLFRWHRKAESASGDSNWTQRITDIWAGRIFSCFVSILFLCGYVGLSKTESICVLSFSFAFGIESLLIALRPSAYSSQPGICWVRRDDVNCLNLHEKCMNTFFLGGGGVLQVGGQI